MTEAIKTKLLSKDMYVPAGFIVMAIVGGMTWQNALSEININKEKLTAMEKTVDILVQQADENDDRIVRLEVQFEQILANLKEIKADVKELSLKE